MCARFPSLLEVYGLQNNMCSVLYTAVKIAALAPSILSMADAVISVDDWTLDAAKDII